MSRRAMMIAASAGGGSGPGYRTLTIDNAAVSGSTKTNFVAWFDVTHNDFKSIANGGFVANANHPRVATDTAGTSILNYDIRIQDLASGRLAGWVLISSYSSSVDTVLYIAYNDNGVTTYQGNRTSVWAAYAFVNHGSDGSSVSGTNATGDTAYNITPQNSPTAATGLFGGSVHFVRASSQDMHQTGGPVRPVSTFSASGWFTPTNFTDYSYFMSMGTGSGPKVAYAIGVQSAGDTNPQKLSLYFTIGGSFKQVIGSTALSASVPIMWAAEYDGVDMFVFLNGVQDHATHAQTGTPDDDNGYVFKIGSDAFNNYANGDIEESRYINATTLGADWYLTRYRLESANATYVTLT